MMSKLIHTLFYSCEHASMHMIKSEEGSGSPLTKFRLWVHKRICAICKLFEQQNQKLNSLVDDIKSDSNRASLCASPETKKRWKEALSDSRLQNGELNSNS